MSTMTSINILLLIAFIVGCAFVRADPVANPECKAAAETNTPPEFLPALLNIQGKLDVVTQLVSDIRVLVNVNAKIELCLEIITNIQAIVSLFLGSCDKMKPTDVASLLINLKIIIQICLAALIPYLSLSLMVGVYVQVLIKLLGCIQILVAVCLKLVLAVNISVLGPLVSICINLGKSIIVNIFADVFALVKLCIQVQLGVSISINAVIQLCIRICAQIKISVNLIISLVVGLLTGTPGVPKQCIDVFGGLGLQITALIEAIVQLCVGVQINITAIIEATLKIKTAIDAIIKLNIGASVLGLVKLVLSAGLDVFKSTCDCYKKAGLSLIGITVVVNIDKLLVAVQVVLKALVVVGLSGVVGVILGL